MQINLGLSRVLLTRGWLMISNPRKAVGRMLRRILSFVSSSKGYTGARCIKSNSPGAGTLRLTRPSSTSVRRLMADDGMMHWRLEEADYRLLIEHSPRRCSSLNGRAI